MDLQTLAQRAEDFKNQYNGVHIDEDGYYGAQCWDLVARFAREKVGCPSLPTGSGGAEGLFRLHQDPIGQYFDIIANDPNDPNQLPPKGAIVVFRASFSPPYGHTALVLGADKGGMDLFEQNGNNPGGAAYIKRRGWTGVSGWLVAKAGGNSNVSRTDLTIGRILSYFVLGRVDPSNNALNGLSDGDINQYHVGVETNEEIWNNYQSGEAQNWIDRIQTKLLPAAARAEALGKELTKANGDLLALQQQIADLGKRPTQQQLDDLTAAVTAANDRAVKAQAELEKLQAQSAEDQKVGNAFTRWIGGILKGLIGK